MTNFGNLFKVATFLILHYDKYVSTHISRALCQKNKHNIGFVIISKWNIAICNLWLSFKDCNLKLSILYVTLHLTKFDIKL